jgi:uncharacterized membrane protein
MKKSLHFLAIIFFIAPVVYLLFIYPQLPATVATHFDLSGRPDDYGSKNSLWIMTLVLSVVTILVYVLLCNVHRIDPKKKAYENKDRLQKIALAVTAFIAAVQIWIIHSTQVGSTGNEPKFIFVGIGILFAIIGNYMENIRPNYFAGLRLPWTLENEDNWRKTHHYASRIWFIGGIVIAVSSLLLPFIPTIIILFTSALTMIILPTVYSYKLYKKNKQNFTT